MHVETLPSRRRATALFLAVCAAFLVSTFPRAASADEVDPTTPNAPVHLTFPSNADGRNVAAGDTRVHRCARITDREVTGTLIGADGLGVNATIGFDMLDRLGHKINVETGCPVVKGAYGAIVQLNHYVSGTGARLGSKMSSRATPGHPSAPEGRVDDHFAVYHLPANVVSIYVEAYTRRYTGSPCGLPCAGDVDTVKYGFVNRHAIKPGRASRNLRLVAPITPRYGGTAGQLLITIPHGHVDYVWAFSTAKDGKVREQGWGIGKPYNRNRRVWAVQSLAGNQAYRVIVNISGTDYIAATVMLKNKSNRILRTKI